MRGAAAPRGVPGPRSGPASLPPDPAAAAAPVRGDFGAKNGGIGARGGLGGNGAAAPLKGGAGGGRDVTSCAPRRSDVTRSAAGRAAAGMPKRRVSFEEPPGEGEGPEGPPRKRAMGGPGSRFPAQPSLDSDEEEEEEEEEEEQGGGGAPVEGQEPGPAPGVGEGPVPLTPFNLEEELGEGRFDPHGHFLPLPQRERPDPWLEQIQGLPIKPRPLPPREPPPSPPSPPPLPHLLGEVLELLRPGETVGGALRRWGGEGRPRPAAAAGGGRGRAPRAPPPPQLEALVALADALVARGVLGVLGESRERLQRRLRALGGRGGPAPRPGGEEPEEEEEEEPEGEGEGSSPPALDMFAPPAEGEGREALPEVLWEYHWGGEGDGDSPLFGPFSSAQMQEWAAQGYFQGGGGARCRRVDPPNPPGPFYDCGRVDFQLYT